MTDLGVARQRRRKPGNLARRLGFALRGVLWTLGGSLAAAYLLIFVSPLPAPHQQRELAESAKVYDREGRLLYDCAAVRDALCTDVPLQTIADGLKHPMVAKETEATLTGHGIEQWPLSDAYLGHVCSGDLAPGRSGTIRLLPAKAYEQYLPEVWGRGDGETFIVREP